MSFYETDAGNIHLNPFNVIGKDWLLITAGDEEKCNTMTASWGAMGVMWGKNAVTVYIRPQRYTKEFVDREGIFTISVLPGEYRKALNFCGTATGRGMDKLKEAGLTPYFIDGTPGIGEARLIFVCRTMYHDTIEPSRFDRPENDEKWYPEKDYHTMYIAEILKVLVKEDGVAD
ncbi:MAG: flavin reductase family protein [Clostridiales bacterium]|nr:flavin reductase family protein [Clostridiales bacterium]